MDVAGAALGFAQDRRTPAQATEAYAAFRPFNKAPVATPLAYQDRWTAWGATYGSYSRADGDGGIGTNDRTVRTGHIAITPITVDLTRYQALEQVASWVSGLADSLDRPLERMQEPAP